MATLTKTVADFNLVSTWQGLYDETDHPPTLFYTTPTTASANKTFSLSGLPADAILDSATLVSTLGSPYTGAAIRQIDSVTYSSETQKNVLSKLQALNANYANGITFNYKFKANGGEGGYGPHSSTLAWRSNTLVITYHMPASEFSTNPASAVNVDTNVAVTITPASASYSHKVIRSIGSNSATTTLAAGANNTTIQFPASWIPSGTSATATVKVETWSGSTKMGETSKTMTVSVPNAAPYLPTITLPVPTHVRGIIPSDWPYTKGKSKAQLNATCAAGSGSAIKSVVVSNGADGNAVLSGGVYTYTTPFISPAGTYPLTVTYRVTVTDNRNKTAYVERSITVHNYYLPSCSNSTAFRCNSSGVAQDNGTYIRIVPAFSIASCDGKNSVTAAYAYYKQLPSGDLSSPTTITSGAAVTVGGGTINVNNSYEVKVVVRDELHPNVAEGTKFIPIPTEWNVMQFNGDRKVAFFGAAENEGFEVKGDKEIRYKGQTLDERYGRMMVYNNPSQLGISLTDTITLEQVVDAMPNYSELIFIPNNTTTSNLSPSEYRYGLLEIVKYTGYRSCAMFFTSGPTINDVYKNVVYNGTAGTWKKLIGNGDILSDRLTMPRLRLTATTDVSGTSANDVALIIGPQSGEHLEFDGNEIMAKSNGSTSSILYLNSDGGDVRVNYQTVYHRGNIQKGTGSVPSLPDGYIYIKYV